VRISASVLPSEYQSLNSQLRISVLLYIWEISLECRVIMLDLHYVPIGHCNHGSGNRGENWNNVKQPWGTALANATDSKCRGCRARAFNCSNICQGSHSADGSVLDRSKTGESLQNTTKRDSA
jgi:hypothetical protein